MTRNSLALALSTVALVIAAAGTGGPAIAGVFASDSHKVDGKHAVGARASVANRAGKLVATNSAGRLPNNIITKAPNADRLDGLDSSALLRKTSPAGTLAFLGQVRSDGVLHASSIGISAASRTSTGNYTVTLPGLDPGCAGTAFVTSLQPFGAALANSAGYSTTLRHRGRELLREHPDHCRRSRGLAVRHLGVRAQGTRRGSHDRLDRVHDHALGTLLQLTGTGPGHGATVRHGASR